MMPMHPIQLISIAVISIGIGHSADGAKPVPDSGKLAIKVAFQQIKPLKSKPRLTNKQLELASDYADSLERQAELGHELMVSYRKSVKSYRNMKAHRVTGKLQAIHNYTHSVDRIYRQVEAKAKWFRKKRGLTPKLVSSQLKKVSYLLNKINNTKNKIEYEMDRIRMIPIY